MPKLIVFLIGMPAAGKTHWGQMIAEAYDLPFIDLDKYITHQEKASVPALFAQYGEKGFREREHKYLNILISKTTETTIVACGGGAPCHSGNLELMKEAGAVIYLETDIATIEDNLKTSDEIRPLLRGRANLTVYLQDLLFKRFNYYTQADYILPTKDISLSTFAKIIESCTNPH
jgi:shikimate kinase